MKNSTPRGSLRITRTTWKALFLRAAVARLSVSRFAWFWMLAEPVAFAVLITLIFTELRVRHIGGIHTAVWVLVGVVSFLMFRRTATHTTAAMAADVALFRSPQIRPADSIFVNAALEGLLMVVVAALLSSGALFLGVPILPADPLRVLEAVFGLWLLGLGYGMINSAMSKVYPPVGLVMIFLMRPLYFVSGVMFPIAIVPYPYRDWLLLNPVLHGLEIARAGFAPYYFVPPEVGLEVLYSWSVCAVFLGSALHVRYARRLAS